MEHNNITNATPQNTKHEEDSYNHNHVVDLELPKKPSRDDDGDDDDANDVHLESFTKPKQGDDGHSHDDGDDDDANDVHLESSPKPRHGDDGHIHDDDDVDLESPTKPTHDGDDDGGDVCSKSSTKLSHGYDGHSHDDGVDQELPTKPTHDCDDGGDDVCLKSFTKPRHGHDGHSHDEDDVDQESFTKPIHDDDDDDDDDDVVDLESAMEGEGCCCNSLMVVDSRFCSSLAMDLLMASNGRFRGREYTIRKGGNNSDERKELLLQLDQPGCSLNPMDKYLMADDTNQPVLCIKQTVKGFLRNERQVFRGHEFKDGGELFRIKRSKFLQFKTSLDVYLQTNVNQDNHCETIQKQVQHPSPDYVVKISWLGSSFDMLHGSKAIAKVRRKSTGWLRKKTFSISLQPEVDYSFVVALTIIADSIYKEHTLAIFTAIIDLIAAILGFLPEII